MAAALECWSSRTSTDEDMVEQVLMRTQDRSEGSSEPTSSNSESLGDSSFGTSVKDSSAMQKRFQRLRCNVTEAISSFKNSLNLESRESRESGERERVQTGRGENGKKFVWSSVVRSLTQLYPGSQLPEKLVSNIRKHYDALPQSYSQAGFEMKDVFLHIRLIEQAAVEEHPAMFIQEVEDEVEGCVFKLTFACNSVISLPVMSGALDGASICCKKIQIFEKKGFTLGIVMLSVESGQEKVFKTRVENALKSAVKRPRPASLKLAFGLCGCQEENMKGREFGEIEEEFGEQSYRNGMENSSSMKLQLPLPDSSIVVSVDEWQTIQSGGEEIGRWLLNSDNVDFNDQLGPHTFKGVYRGKKIGIEKMKGCDKGNAYEFEVKRDLLELMTCGHKNILQFCGVCIHDNHGLCVATKLMEGGSVHDLIMKKKKLQTKDITRMAIDIAEGIKFMNDHGVVYRDLNTQRILLDKQGNVCLGDMGIISACKSSGEAMEYETDGYRWLAPEIIAGDPETVTETWMSNVYSFGMILWEMVTGEVAYSAYSPVQAAVGIAACGLRPDIPKDCPQILKALMNKCWNNSPSKRPQFSEILSMLSRPGTNSNSSTR